MIAVAAAAGLALAGCGSGARQDAGAPSGNFPVQVSAATFPASQTLSEHTKLVIAVRNTGNRAIPNVAVTICNVTCHYPAPTGEGTSVAAFAQYLNMPDVASHSRQVWVVDRPPGASGYSSQNGGAGSAFSADANTWALGRLRPGQTATFTWNVTAVAPGRHVVAWEVAGDLYGKAKAVLASGGGPCGNTPCGQFNVNIARTPTQSYVNDNGQVVTGG